MDRHISYKPRSRLGFTMIELLVSIGILGLLMAILVPAVQQVRVTSRSMLCKNNLRQIGIAMHNFQEQKGVFPGSVYNRSLLPYLEQKALWELLDGYAVSYSSLEEVGSGKDFQGITIPVMACPSDPAQSIARDRALSYFMNTGTGWGDHDDGFLGRKGHASRPIKPADVTDGLSQTVAFSERLVYRGDKEPGVHKKGVFTPTLDQQRRRTATTDPFRGADQMNLFADTCRDRPTWFGGWANRVICTPFSGGCSFFDYNHIMTPNQNSCFNGAGDAELLYLQYSAQTASSLHTGGVNILLGDGAVRFVSDSIDRSIWRALGTRAGQEANAMTF